MFILQSGSRPLDPPDETTGAIRVFEGEKRLHAIEFWMRYPDYLADALLDEYEASRDPELLARAEAIFDDEEPSVRVVKMLRWKRGAFDRIEDALAVLSARRLVLPVLKPLATGGRQHDFYVFEEAQKFLDEAVADQPSLAWYRDRAALVMRIAQFKSGHALKSEQYEFPEYKDAPLNTFIPSIQSRVKKRLNELKDKAA
ncbi:hypothetical protein [Methylosinus sp. RM1]|uniref:hypothetical protein n=1 Tax=Methylosinus sp. RM1 TaxID=2583817 RepID=UPI001FF02CD3|nr:hypothetical protein [Methylosinus sp. RM1]